MSRHFSDILFVASLIGLYSLPRKFLRAEIVTGRMGCFSAPPFLLVKELESNIIASLEPI